MNKHFKQHERGLALLVTLLLITVLLGVSASLLNVTLKQYLFSNIGLQSEMAFQAANAGMECILYQDHLIFPSSRFDVPGDGSGVAPESGVQCMGQLSDDLVNGGNSVSSGEEQRFRFSWHDTTVTGSPTLCSDVSIYKFFSNTASPSMTAVMGRSASCPMGSTCTIVKSRGYNVPCTSITTRRTIEREYTQVY